MLLPARLTYIFPNLNFDYLQAHQRIVSTAIDLPIPAYGTRRALVLFSGGQDSTTALAGRAASPPADTAL